MKSYACKTAKIQICCVFWQPCFTGGLFYRFLVSENIGLDSKIMFLGQLDAKLCSKQPKGKFVVFSGNPVLQIWQYCWLKAFQNSSIRFLLPKNIGIDRKFMFLGHRKPLLIFSPFFFWKKKRKPVFVFLGHLFLMTSRAFWSINWPKMARYMLARAWHRRIRGLIVTRVLCICVFSLVICMYFSFFFRGDTTQPPRNFLLFHATFHAILFHATLAF